MTENRQILTRAELVMAVGQLASTLSRLGVVRGDRVAGYLPNRFETLIAFLAHREPRSDLVQLPAGTFECGALDRLAQIEPKVLVAVSGYRYGGKSYDRAAALTEITANLPTLRHLIIVEQAADEQLPDCGLAIPAWRWSELLARRVIGCAPLFRAGAVRSSALDPLFFRDDRHAQTDCPRTWGHSP